MSSRLPPGQIETRLFPVVGERDPGPGLESNNVWALEIGGLVDEARILTLDHYLGLEHRELVFDVHCVTSWTRFGSRFTGVPIAELIRPLPEAEYVSFTAYSQRDHDTSLPLEYALEHSWLVHELDGEPLTREHGGPVRVVTPGKYFYKSVKWVRRIDLLAEDRLGWWEANSAYHNGADPWAGDQRFISGSLRPVQLERFLTAERYDKYRNRVMIGLDLRRWQPASSDLRRLYLKNCDLRGVDLSGADLRESNLSLSDLGGANLAGADLSGSDLEGVDFTGADLSGADLSGTALSATRFDGATVEGARFEGVWGLVESQLAYLAGRGIPL